MPFKERSFPPGWRPLDDIEHWPFETEDGLRIACEELGIRVDDDEGFSMDGVGCLNSLMEHYGLPNRDAGSCAVHDMQDEKVYNEFLSEAEKSRYNLGERMHGYCKHILYVLRFILNCPPELPFRDAFNLQEYHDVFAHSYPAQALKNAKSPNEDWRKVLDRIPHDGVEAIYYFLQEDELLVCLNCFRSICYGHSARPCHGCGNLVHTSGCQKDMPTIKSNIVLLHHPRPKSRNCAVCRDKLEWEAWTRSRAPPLSGDYQSCEEQMKEEPLESKLGRIKYRRMGNIMYRGSGTLIE
ncbi:unnamed protein product [Sordaria macrospora k-hell]|uniref:WGS project CABT00000000 data, contig 2.73 n=1 Tax=Sordaria macrospora (strain ATCC MYA-333 / DSM 997 / K(L3346) / K-hell) TaxID=771870 RepID=F7WBD0_SORMK|nr:uncharacterized protein SMAC_09136 [Sordaria macrospora k-hell]CCC14408.1 unnamed protein product [Sordaria macrospora k-hell]